MCRVGPRDGTTNLPGRERTPTESRDPLDRRDWTGRNEEGPLGTRDCVGLVKSRMSSRPQRGPERQGDFTEECV